MTKKILVVDDEEDVVELLRMRLEMGGFEVVQAINGERALNVFDAEKPDLVILDLMMPHIDGRSFLKLVRASSSHWPVPVIVLTAKTDLNAVKRMEGVTEAVTKSMEGEDLIILIKKHL